MPFERLPSGAESVGRRNGRLVGWLVFRKGLDLIRVNANGHY